MLEPILQGFIEWLYTIFVDTADYVFGDLMDVLTMDMTYFRKVAPVVTDIAAIIRALGWAMLIGNLVFQALKSMMSGAGFEGEDPRLLFTRTFAFSFLLLASDQICEICMQMTRRVVTLLSMPATFKMTLPTEAHFIGFACNWMLVAIVGIIIIIQMVKLFVDIGERYVITCVLTFMAPMAFAMGGSRNTSDIFKGWCRMYGSMNLMLIMNIVFLKLIISAMSHMVSSGVILWVVFIVALTRVARKIDAHIAKIGLNPAQAGNSLGVRLPGAMTMVVVKSLASMVGKSAGAARNGANHSHSGGNPPPNGYRGRGANPAPPPNCGNPAAETGVNVNVSSQSRGARVNVPGGSASTVHSSNQFNANSQAMSANNSSRSESASFDTSSSSNSSRVQNQTQNAGRGASSRPVSMSSNTAMQSTDRHEANSTTVSMTSGNPSQNVPRASNPSRPPLSRNTAGISQTSVQTNTTNTSQEPSQHDSTVNSPRAAATPSAGNASQTYHHSSSHNANTNANVSAPGGRNTSVNPSSTPGGVNVSPAVKNSTPANPAVSQSHSTVTTSETRSGSTVPAHPPSAHPQVNVPSGRNGTSPNPAVPQSNPVVNSSGTRNGSHSPAQVNPQVNVPSGRNGTSSNPAVSQSNPVVNSSGIRNGSHSPSPAHPQVNVPSGRNGTSPNPAVAQNNSAVNVSGTKNGSHSPSPANPQVNVASSGNDTSVNPVNTSNHSSANTPLNRTGASVNVQTAPNGSRNTAVPIVSVPTASAHISSNHDGGENNTVVSTQSASNSNVKDDSNSSTVNTSHTHNNTTSSAPAGVNSSHINITHSPNTSNIVTIGGASSHHTSITTPQQRIDHTHQHGRHDPAAANRKGHRYYFTKATETTKLNREQPKRGEEHGETTKEKRKGRGGSQRTDA